MIRCLWAIPIVASILLAFAGGSLAAPLPAGALMPCPTEDSTGCYWDADTMGNGVGSGVLTVEVTP